MTSSHSEGPDCHRTYEAMVAGAIPIVKRYKGLEEVFAEEPVLVVEQWSDLTPGLLKSEQAVRLLNRSSARVAWLPHWVDAMMPDARVQQFEALP